MIEGAFNLRKDGLILGLFLIVMGTLWLLGNLGFIDFTIYDLGIYIRRALHLWPLALIIIGVNIATDNQIVRGVAWGVILIILVSYLFFGTSVDPVFNRMPFSNHMRMRDF